MRGGGSMFFLFLRFSRFFWLLGGGGRGKRVGVGERGFADGLCDTAAGMEGVGGMIFRYVDFPPLVTASRLLGYNNFFESTD